MAYRPLMSEDRLVGASGCRSSRAFQGAAGRRSSGSSESATSRGEEASAVEGSCAQLWRYTVISIHLKKFFERVVRFASEGDGGAFGVVWRWVGYLRSGLFWPTLIRGRAYSTQL